MINTSDLYKNAILKGREFEYKAHIAFADGTVINLNDKKDLMASGVALKDGTSRNGSFDIGSVIINELLLTINNSRDKFSAYDFYGAVITAWIGLHLPDGTVEYLKKGVYTVDEPVSPGMTISVTALDNMAKFDCDYAGVNTSYPATLLQIVQDLCLHCGVPLASSRFDNDDYIVQFRPDDDALTCRDVLSYVAQISGCFARCNVNGALEIKWYDTTVFEDSDVLNGGRFDNYNLDQYETGDSSDGGYFDDLDPAVYRSGDTYGGGSFQAAGKYHHFYALSSLSTSTDDVVITGIQVTADASGDAEGEVYMYGAEGYVLSVEDNPLILPGKAHDVAEHLGAKIAGMRFRPLSCSALSDPSVEAGDCAYISDRKGNSYACYLTNVSFSIGNYMSLSCDAKTPSANSAKRYSAETRAIVKARQEVKKQISAYDLAVQQLTSLITQSFGVFKTVEVLEDGSTVYYLHNKPTLEESQTIWKMIADAFAVSTDGGQTWNAGMDSSGNAVVNVLSAIGINFDWARGGTIVLGGENNGDGVCKVLDAAGNEVARLDKDGLHTSNASITGGNLSINSGSGYDNVIALTYDGTTWKGLNCQRPTSGKWIDWQNSMYRMVAISGAGILAGIVSEMSADATMSSPGFSVYIGSDGKASVSVIGTIGVSGSFGVEGTKNRIVKTKNYGKVLQYCYEMPSPMFGDIGGGIIGEDGLCYVYFDQIFRETVASDISYYVFLQKEGEGDLWVSEKTQDYFLVCGTPDLKFSWEAKVRQIDYEYNRLDVYDNTTEDQDIDYANMASIYLDNYEKEILNYEETN